MPDEPGQDFTEDERAAYQAALDAITGILEALPDWMRLLVVGELVYLESPAGRVIEAESSS